MSYGKKYTIDAVAKTEPTETVYTCEIWEKDYGGSSSAFDAGAHPFTAQILASSDDPFDPVLSSTLTLMIDITDFTGTLPDFTSTDDRKYWVKFYNTGTSYFVWQGFMIMQSVNVPFITGRTFLQCLCTDGLAILKNEPYAPTNPDINVAEDLSTVITNCLNKINLPNGYYLNYCVGVYALGMDTSKSVFKQAYYYPRNWMSSAPTPTATGTAFVSTYLSCYEVLSNIVFAFGAQIFQSYGQYWIANVNDRANDSIRSFQTTNANGAESLTVRFTQRQIVPYVNTTDSPWYFQDAVQAKILRKGYPYFEFKCSAQYAPNMADNGVMSELSSGFPRNWGTIGIGGVTLTSLGRYNAINMAPTGGGPTVRTVGTYPVSLAKVYQGDTFSFSFLLDGQATISTTPKCKLQVILTPSVGSQQYMDADGNWSTTSGYISVIGNTTDTYESKSYTARSTPVSGSLRINFICDNFDTLTATIANLQLTYSSVYDYRLVRNTGTSTSYKKLVEFYFGGPCDQFNYSQRASLLDSAGDTLRAWFRYGISESFDDLTKLIGQQYYNIQSVSVINFDCTLRNLLDLRSTVLSPKKIPHVIGSLDNVTIEDTTGTTLSVNGKYYTSGALNYDYTEDTLSGTLLQVANTDLTVTFTDNTILKS